MNFLQRLAAAPSKVLWLAEAATGVCKHSGNPKVKIVATILDKVIMPRPRRWQQNRMAAHQNKIREASQ